MFTAALLERYEFFCWAAAGNIRARERAMGGMGFEPIRSARSLRVRCLRAVRAESVIARVLNCVEKNFDCFVCSFARLVCSQQGECDKKFIFDWIKLTFRVSFRSETFWGVELFIGGAMKCWRSVKGPCKIKMEIVFAVCCLCCNVVVFFSHTFELCTFSKLCVLS